MVQVTLGKDDIPLILEALEKILFDTYIQFDRNSFKQIPMGGKASPFIVDLYLSMCEYFHVTKTVRIYYT